MFTAISGSTALLADALHMTSDFVSYALSIGILELTLRQQRRNGRLKSSGSTTEAGVTRGDDYAGWLTFGFARLEVLGALGIIAVVWGATLVIVVQAIKRMSAPPEVDGATVVFTACGGLVVDVVLLRMLDSEPGGGNSSGGHGHSHSRVFRAYGRCHGFDVDVSTGGWFNAGHADNLFGGTGFGRRIVPVARAARLRRYAHTLETCTLITH